MKEIGTIYPSPVSIKEINAIQKEYKEKLAPLLDSPDFQKHITSIRDKFDIPMCGIKGFLGTTDKVAAEAKKLNQKKYNRRLFFKTISHAYAHDRHCSLRNAYVVNWFSWNMPRICSCLPLIF